MKWYWWYRNGYSWRVIFRTGDKFIKHMKFVYVHTCLNYICIFKCRSYEIKLLSIIYCLLYIVYGDCFLGNNPTRPIHLPIFANARSEIEQIIFHSFEVVGRASETQVQVSENLDK